MSVANVSCTKCEKEFQVKTKYFQKFGSDPFCQDCLIHTECQSCNSGLRLRPSRFKELGGGPVLCTECNVSDKASNAGQKSPKGLFWPGLTIGEKIAFPIILTAFLGLLALAGIAEMNGGNVETPLLLPMVLLLYWMYRRGKKKCSNQ